MGCCCCYTPIYKNERKRTHVPGGDSKEHKRIKTPEDIVFWPKFPATNKSLLQKHLGEMVWGRLRTTKDSAGFTFKQSIWTGCNKAADLEN